MTKGGYVWNRTIRQTQITSIIGRRSGTKALAAGNVTTGEFKRRSSIIIFQKRRNLLRIGGGNRLRREAAVCRARMTTRCRAINALNDPIETKDRPDVARRHTDR